MTALQREFGDTLVRQGSPISDYRSRSFFVRRNGQYGESAQAGLTAIFH